MLSMLFFCHIALNDNGRDPCNKPTLYKGYLNLLETMRTIVFYKIGILLERKPF